MTIIRVKRGTRPPVAGVTTTKVMSETVTMADAVPRVLRRARVMTDTVILGDGKAIGAAAGTPVILFTDIVSGPMGGSGTTNDENGLGTYLRIYGLNFGTFSDYGSTASVTIGGQAVGNYRFLRTAPSGDVFSPVIQELCVQVGARGSLNNGTAYAIQVTTSAGASNTDMTFEPNPGTIYWIDGVNGNNANAGTFAAPFKDAQTVSGGEIAGGAITSARATPGNTFIWKEAGTYQTSGKDDMYVRYFRLGGSNPTGSAGTGYIHNTCYPGAAGANDPDDVYIFRPTGKLSAFAGNDTDRSEEASGAYGKYLSFSGFRIDEHAGAQDGPFNVGSQGDFWRVVGNFLGPWPANIYSKAAGVAGNGDQVFVAGNYIHDLESPTNETHGVYLDGSNGPASDHVSTNWRVCYNKIEDIIDGTGIQIYGEGATSGGVSTGNLIFCNHINGTSKYGINFSHQAKSAHAYNNVIMNTGAYSIRSESNTSQIQFTFAFNTCYNPMTGGGGSNSFYANEWDITTSGSKVEIKNNIFVMGASRSNNTLDWFDSGNDTVSAHVYDYNLFYDPQGHTPSGAGSHPVYGNPLFVTPYTNLRLSAGSPASNAAIGTLTYVTVNTDFDNKTRPKSGNTNKAIGAFELA